MANTSNWEQLINENICLCLERILRTQSKGFIVDGDLALLYSLANTRKIMAEAALPPVLRVKPGDLHVHENKNFFGEV